MKYKFIMLIGVMMILLAGQVLGLGITPGRTTIDFAPGLEKTIEFSVINSEHKYIDLVIMIQGELNESISVSEVSFHMNANEEAKSLSYTLRMPNKLLPGTRKAEVVVVQLPEKSKTSEAYVGATVGVATQVNVVVPYPDKYAEAALNIIGSGAEKATFVIPVVNKGSIDLVRVRAVIDIYSSLNEKVATLNTQELSIPIKSRGELAVKWDKDVPAGPYRAVASVIYDEEIIRLEKEFNVGSQELGVESIEVPNFRLGEIAKFETLVENKWSEAIHNAYVQMQVFDSNKNVMADFKSATYDVPALSKALLVSFWDTAGVKEGTYNADIILNYAKKSTTNKVQFEISNDELRVVGVGYVISSAGKSKGESSYLTTILIVVIGVLVLINILWFLVLRKKLNK